MALNGDPSSVLAVVVPGILPAQVVGVSVTTPTSNSLTVQWSGDTTGSGVRAYIVEYQPANNTPWSLLTGAPVVDNTNIFGNSQTYTQVAANLPGGSTFNFRVTAVNNQGSGPTSSVVSGTTTSTASGGTTTWNSQTMTSGGMSLDSSTQKVATSIGQYGGRVFSTTAQSTGRLYASAVITKSSPDWCFGIANANLAAYAPLGADTNGAGVRPVQVQQALYINDQMNTGLKIQASSPNGATLVDTVNFLYDMSGEKITFTGSGIGSFSIQFNGTTDANGGTNNAQAMIYNGLVWRQEGNGNWHSKLNSSATWSGAVADPRMAQASNMSPQNTVIYNTTSSLISYYGETVTLSGSGSGSFQIAFNGTVDTTDSSITQAMQWNGLIWKQNTAGTWFYKAQAVSPWSTGQADPRTTASLESTTADEVVIALDLTASPPLLWWTDLAMINNIGKGSWNNQSCTPFVNGGIPLTGLGAGPYYLCYSDDLNGQCTLKTGSNVGSVLGITLPSGGVTWDATTTTGVVLPGAPTSVSATMTAYSAVLSWTAATGSPTATRVKFRKSGTTPWFNGAATVGNTTTVYGLLNGTSYDFSLIASNSAGDGPASTTLVQSTQTATVSFLRWRGLNAKGSDLSANGFSSMRTDVTGANAVIIPVVCSTASQTSTDVQLDTPLSTTAQWAANAIASGFDVIYALYLSCRDQTSSRTITPGPSTAGVANFFKNLTTIATQAATSAKGAGAKGLLCGVELQPWAGKAQSDTGPFSVVHMAQWQALYTACKAVWPDGIISYAAAQTALGYAAPTSDWSVKWNFWDAVVFNVFPNIKNVNTTKTTIESFLDSKHDLDPNTSATTGNTPVFNALQAYAGQLGRKIIISACGIVPATGNQATPETPITIPPPYDYTMGTAWWQAVTDEVTKHVATLDGFFAYSGSISGATGTAYGVGDYYGVRGYSAASAISQVYSNLAGNGNVVTLTAPTNLATSNVTSTSFTATYSAVLGNNISYIGQTSTDQNTWTSSAPTTGLSILFSSLTPATTYYVRVQAVSGASSSPFSTPATVATLAGSGTQRTYTLQPGADGCIWNEPMHDGVVLSASTDPMTTDAQVAGTINSISYGAAISVGAGTDQLVTFTSTGTSGTQRDVPLSAQIHVPIGTQSSGPYPGSNNLTLFDTTQPYKMWSFTNVLTDGSTVKASTTTVSVGQGEVDDASGFMEDQTTGNYGFNQGVGVIRAWELDPTKNTNKQINHSLRFTAPAARMRAPRAWNDTTTIMPDGYPSIFWPATHTDFNAVSTYTGHIPAGCTLCIPQSDVAPTGWPDGAMMLYNNAKNFGWVWRGTGPTGINLYTEPSAEGTQWLTDMRQYFTQIVARLRVVLNQTGASTRKGPGNRIANPPPPLNISASASALSVNAVANIINGSGFYVSGSLSGYSTAPTLNYADDTGAFQALPSGSIVTTTSFKFLHPALATGSHTITVKQVGSTTNLATISVAVPSDVKYVPPSGGTSTPTSNNFYVSNGAVYYPSGQRFIGRGVGVPDYDMGKFITNAQGQPLTTLYPGINMIRLACYSYYQPSYYTQIINWVTTQGIILVIEDHQNSAGTNNGAGSGPVMSGTMLSNELTWYSNLAGATIGNGYVWYGTTNEPSYNPSLSALSQWQRQVYNAIRNTGNNTIIEVEQPAGGNPNTMGSSNGLDVSQYNTMKNIVFGPHFYSWTQGGDKNNVAYSVLYQNIQNTVTTCQTITSQDGVVPVGCFEYGPSTDGVNLDVSGTTNVSAVQDAVTNKVLFCCLAWWVEPGSPDSLLDGNMNQTSYGSQVQAAISKNPALIPPSSVNVVTPPSASVPTATGGNATAASVLQLLDTIKGKNVILSQYIERGGDPTNGFAAIQQIQTQTGKWLGAIGGDYWYYGSNQPTADTTFNQYAKQYWSAGGLVGLTLSMPNPTTMGSKGIADTSQLNTGDLFTPGTTTNTNFLSMIDSVASALSDLQNSGVVVLIRPFHENNGNWYWWGTGLLTDTLFKQLWQLTHDRLVITHNLTNLIWVNALNSGINLTSAQSRFPGTAYVDINAYDAYTSTPSSLTTDYNNLLQVSPGMRVIWTEFGPGSPSAGDLSFAETTLVAALKSFPNFSLCSQWWDSNGTSTGWGMKSTSGWSTVKNALLDPYVYNRGDFTLPAIGSTTLAKSSYPTADGSQIANGSDQALYDNVGNAWTIGTGNNGSVSVNGVQDATSANVKLLAWVGGKMWHENTSNMWWAKTLPTDSWSPTNGTSTSPFTSSTTTTNPTPSPTSITLLCLGDDSIEGANVPGGYRYYLYNDLVSDGYTVTMVGDHQTNPGNLASAQQSHDGYGGYCIDLPSGQTDTTNPSLFALIKANGTLAKWKPTWIDILCGINNMYVSAPANVGPDTAYTYLKNMINYCFQQLPNVIVNVFTLPPVVGDLGNPSASGPGLIQIFNNHIVNQLKTDIVNSNLYITDINTVENNASGGYSQFIDSDTLHQNATGCQAMAQASRTTFNKVYSTTNTTPVTPTNPTGNQVVTPLSSATTGSWQVFSYNGMYYKLLTPSGYNPNTIYPFILYLHQLQQGNGFYQDLASGKSPQSANDWVQNEIDPWFNSVAFRQACPCILAAPLLDMTQDTSNGNNLNWGGVSSNTQPSETAIFQGIIPQIQSAFSVDTSKMFMTGNSMGGIGSWDYSIKYNYLTGTVSKIFKASLILAGAVYDYGNPTPSATVISNLTNYPIFAIHGGQDGQVPLFWDQNMYAAYGGSTAYDGSKAPNGNMKYLQDPNLGHDVWDTYYAQTGANSPLSWLYNH